MSGARLGALAALVTLAPPALAAPRLTAEYHTGGPTPLGYYGLGLDVQPLPWISVSGGVGLMNFQGSSQLQLAIAPRFRWPALSWLALDVGLALSRGRRSDYVALPIEQTFMMAGLSVTRTWSPGHRLGPELGLELLPLPHARLRLYGGLAFPLEEGSCRFPQDDPAPPFQGPCGDPQVPAQARDSQGAQPYLGLAVGWSPMAPEAHHLPPTRWYGWQTLLIDAGAAALLVASGPGADSRRTPFRYAAEKQVPLVHLAGGPLVHFAHRSPRAALGSLMLRGGLLAVTATLGSKWDRSECIRFDCTSSYLMTAGAALAAATDAALIAWER